MMEWWLVLVLAIGLLVIAMLSGLPVAFAFLLINLLGAVVVLGGEAGLRQLVLNISESLTSFSLLPVPLFVLMGEVMFRSNMAPKAIDVLDCWIGRVPGRLALLAVMSGTLFSTMSGSTVATTAMLGSLLLPEMEKRGYKRSMSIGPIMGSGGLSMLIPPSALAVLLAALCQISVGRLLMAGVLPGLLIALFYTLYVVLRSILQPHVAPAYQPPNVSIVVKVRNTIVYVLPLTSIVFLVVGLIFLGVATPSEAAALGALGTIVLAAAYGNFSFAMLRDSFMGAVRVTAMMFMIIMASMTFSQILAFSGATEGMINFVTGLDMPPLAILISMQLMLLFLGCFMDNLSMVMVAIPIYMPIAKVLGFDLIWFALLMLINMEMANTTPPFGLLLFVMKGVAPPGTTMAQIYKAGLPFLLCDATAMALVMAFPQIALYLPEIMR